MFDYLVVDIKLYSNCWYLRFSIMFIFFIYCKSYPLSFRAATRMAIKMKVSSIGVVGGGIAGLSLAASLKRLNCDVEKVVVFESRKSLKSNLGGGLQLTGGAAVIDKLGLLKTLKNIGNPIKRIVSRNSAEQVLLNMDVKEIFDKYGENKLQSADSNEMYAYSIMRDDLCSMLVDATTMTNNRNSDESNTQVKLEINKKVKSIIEDVRNEKLRIEFVDGTLSEDFDIIIGADGVSSVVRNYTEFGDTSLFSNDFNPQDKYSGIRISYCVTPVMLEDPRGGDIGSFNQWQGDGCYALVASYGSENGLQHMLAVVYKDNENANYGLNSDWINEDNQTLIKKNLKSRLKKAGFVNNKEINALLEASDQKGGRFFDLGIKDSLIPLKKWSSKSGRIIIIGDSAHTMSPFLGQGANQALQDSYCLASLIKKYNKEIIINPNLKIQKISKEFELKRKFITSKLTLKSRLIGFIETLGNPIGTLFKYNFFRFLGTIGFAQREYVDGSKPII